MEEDYSKLVQAFLTDNQQMLEEKEEVLYIATNKGSDFEHFSNIFLVLFLFFMFLVLFAFDLGISIISGVVVVCLLFITYFFYENKEPNSSKPYGLISTMGIRTGREVIPWQSVFDIKIKPLNDKLFLLFDLIPNQNQYELQNVNTSNSFQSTGFIFLGGDYNAEELQQRVLAYWEPVSPESQLQQLSNELLINYKLTEKRENTYYLLEGSTKNLGVSFSFDSSFPFEKVKTTIKLPKPIPAFLNIRPETTSTKFKQRISGKDIQTGNPNIDDWYLFESSQPAQLQELLSGDLLLRFERLLSLGTVDWSFGKSIKQKRIKTKASAQDSEDVLDTQFLQTSTQETSQSTDFPLLDTLEFKGKLHTQFMDNPLNAVEYTELCLEFSVLFGESLLQLKMNE